MTPPIEGKRQTPVLTGNVGLNASVKNFGCDRILLFGSTAEGRIQHKGYYAEAGVTAGTGLSVNAEIGKEFDINKNWGLELSANANHTRSLLGTKNESMIIHNIGINGECHEESANADWTPGVTIAGVKAMANYTTDNGKFTFGAGVSGQYARNNAKNLSLTSTATDGQTTQSMTTVINNRKEGFVVSPELKATWNANRHISVEANGNAFGGGVTARYTF